MIQQPQKFIDFPNLRKLVQAGHIKSTALNSNEEFRVGPASQGEVDAFARLSTPESLVDTIRDLPGNEIIATRALAKVLGMRKKAQ